MVATRRNIAPPGEALALHCGDFFVQNLEQKHSLFDKVHFIVCNVTKPSLIANVAFDTPNISTTLTAKEQNSFRYKIGRALLAANKSTISHLQLPARLFFLYLKRANYLARERRFQTLDLGLPNDPVLNARMPDRRIKASIRKREMSEILTRMRSQIDESTNRTAPYHSPALYVSGIPPKLIPNGYMVRTQQLLGHLKSQNHLIHHLYMGYNRSAEQDIELDDRSKTVYMDIDSNGSIRNLIESAKIEIAKEAQIKNCQLILAGSNWMNGFSALLAARELGLPFIYDIRGLWHLTRSAVDSGFKNTRSFVFQSQAEVLMMEAADHLICISDMIKNYAIDQGVSGAKFSIVTNGISKAGPDQVEPAPVADPGTRESVILAFAGSITAYERLDIVIRMMAANKRLKLIEKIQFHIIGQGPAVRTLKALAIGLGVDADIKWVGPVPKSSVFQHLRPVNLMVYPRSNEAVFELVPPLKPLEPMLWGIPCLFSHIAPHVELAGEKQSRGVLVNSYKPEDWLTAVKHLVENPGQMQEMTRRSRAWVLAERSSSATMSPLDRLFHTRDL